MNLQVELDNSHLEQLSSVFLEQLEKLQVYDTNSSLDLAQLSPASPRQVPFLSPRAINGQSQKMKSSMLWRLKYSQHLKSRAQTALMEGHLLLEKHYTSPITTLDPTLGRAGSSQPCPPAHTHSPLHSRSLGSILKAYFNP